MVKEHSSLIPPLALQTAPYTTSSSIPCMHCCLYLCLCLSLCIYRSTAPCARPVSVDLPHPFAPHLSLSLSAHAAASPNTAESSRTLIEMSALATLAKALDLDLEKA